MRDWAALDVVRRDRPHAQAGGRSCRSPSSGIVSRIGRSALRRTTPKSRALAVVAAQAGYWRLFHSPGEIPRLRHAAWVIFGAAGRAHARRRHCAGQARDSGEDLPRDVFLEWTGWVMKLRYFFDDATLREALANFPRYRGALRAICLDRRSVGAAGGDRPFALGLHRHAAGTPADRPARARRRPDRAFRTSSAPLTATRSGARPRIGWKVAVCRDGLTPHLMRRKPIITVC